MREREERRSSIGSSERSLSNKFLRRRLSAAAHLSVAPRRSVPDRIATVCRRSSALQSIAVLRSRSAPRISSARHSPSSTPISTHRIDLSPQLPLPRVQSLTLHLRVLIHHLCRLLLSSLPRFPPLPLPLLPRLARRLRARLRGTQIQPAVVWQSDERGLGRSEAEDVAQAVQLQRVERVVQRVLEQRQDRVYALCLPVSASPPLSRAPRASPARQLACSPVHSPVLPPLFPPAGS